MQEPKRTRGLRDNTGRLARRLTGWALGILIVAPALADVLTTVTFEEITPNPPPAVPVRYSNMGFLFPRTAVVRSLGPRAHSSPNVLISRDPPQEWDPAPAEVAFTLPVRTVSVYTGVPTDTKGATVTVRLEAFDQNGTLVASDSAVLVGPTLLDTELRVAAPGTKDIITRVRLSAEQGGTTGFEYLDDVSIISEVAPPMVAHEPPQISITSPTASLTTSGQIVIGGTIEGEGLFPDWAPPELTITFPSPAALAIPQHHQDFELNTDLFWVTTGGAPNQKLQFVLPFQLPCFGDNTLRVEASNAVGVGADQVTITYFPKAIWDLYNQEGGAGSFGGFIWGTTIDGCSFALYDQGVIFDSAAGTYSSHGDIFTKWRDLPTSSGLGLMGCAIGKEKNVAGGTMQDFSEGRIYDGPKGTYFVLEPFITAIDKLDFITKYGLPVTDTWTQSQLLLPSRWQGFEVTVGGITFASTMEVTDKPATLWVATPDLDGVQRSGGTPSARTATVWRSFPCSSPQGPCQGLAQPASVAKMPYSTLEQACEYSHYPAASDGPPQWASLAPKTIVPFFGNLQSTDVSDEDVPWNHTCIISGFPGVDWCTHIVPEPGLEKMLGDDTSSGPLVGQKQTTLQVEYEWCLVGFPIPKDPDDLGQGVKDNLQVGDRLWVAGRFISDCGCHPSFGATPSEMCKFRYDTEIHPPAVMVDIHTRQSGGLPATRAEMIYLDWWYPLQKVELDLFPPPRLGPTAMMTYSRPLWTKLSTCDGGKAGIAVTAEPKNAPNHLHLVISGRCDVSFHTPPVENLDNGQLFHGHITSTSVSRPVDPNYPHTLPLWGSFDVCWSQGVFGCP